MTILDAIHDPHLFRPLFKNLDTWRNGSCVLKAIFGLPMDEAETQHFTQLTGRKTPPRDPGPRVLARRRQTRREKFHRRVDRRVLGDVQTTGPSSVLGNGRPDDYRDRSKASQSDSPIRHGAAQCRADVGRDDRTTRL